METHYFGTIYLCEAEGESCEISEPKAITGSIEHTGVGVLLSAEVSFLTETADTIGEDTSLRGAALLLRAALGTILFHAKNRTKNDTYAKDFARAIVDWIDLVEDPTNEFVDSDTRELLSLAEFPRYHEDENDEM